MKRTKEFFDKDKFAKYVGLEIVEFDYGYSKIRLKVEKKHLNGVDIAHGGAIFTLADFAFAVASNSYDDITALSINASISYIKAVKENSILIAQAKEVSKNKRLAVYNIDITNENGELVATFCGNVYIKR